MALTRQQWLLVKLCEECQEVSQRVTKALTFGIAEVQEGQELNNSDRISEELADLILIYKMLINEGVLAEVPYDYNVKLNKRESKVERWFRYAQQEGIVEP